MSRAFPRSRRPISPPPTSSAIASSCSASRCSTPKGIEQRVHPTMVRKDSAHRAGDGRDQRRDHRRRGHQRRSRWSGRAPAAWRPPRRCWPTSPTSRAACARRRSAARPRGSTSVRKAPMQRHEGGYYIRLLARDRPGTAATIAKRLAEQEISLESIVQRHRQRRAGGDGKGGVRPRHPHHLCDHRGRRAQGACRGGAR